MRRSHSDPEVESYLRKAERDLATATHMSKSGVDGPIPMSGDAADASGQMQFKNQDLRSMRTITVVNTKGAERQLSKSEMRELMTAGELTLIWR